IKNVSPSDEHLNNRVLGGSIQLVGLESPVSGTSALQRLHGLRHRNFPAPQLRKNFASGRRRVRLNKLQLLSNSVEPVLNGRVTNSKEPLNFFNRPVAA